MITVGAMGWGFRAPKAMFFCHEEASKNLDFIAVHCYPAPKQRPLETYAERLKLYDHGKPIVLEEISPLNCSVEQLNVFIDAETLVVDKPRVIISPDPEYPKQFDPRKPFKVTIPVLNKNALDLDEVRVRIRSTYFDEEQSVALAPYGKGEVSWTFNVSPFIEPDEDSFQVTLLVKNETVLQD